jgi:ribosomal protein L30/L7E
MEQGIILLRSMIDKNPKVKRICNFFKLNKVNSFSKIDKSKITQNVIYRLNKYAIWGEIDPELKLPNKIKLHPIRGGFRKLKKFGNLENFSEILKNMLQYNDKA